MLRGEIWPWSNMRDMARPLKPWCDRKDQLAVSIGLKEEVHILAAENLGEISDGEEKFFRGIDPAGVIFGQGAGRDEAMEMKMSV